MSARKICSIGLVMLIAFTLTFASATSVSAGGIGSIVKKAKKAGKSVSNAAKKSGKSVSDVAKNPSKIFSDSNLPTLSERLKEIRKQYDIVEYNGGFVTRWDAQAHTVTLMTKLKASHSNEYHEKVGVVAYKHSFGTRYLSYAAAKWHNPFRGK